MIIVGEKLNTSRKSIEEAVSLLASYGREAKVVAGGTDLLNLMRTGALTPKYLIDITRIPGLDFMGYDEAGGLRIGALVTLSTVEVSKLVKEKYPLLYEAVHQMGTTQVRNRATVVGNLCRASPSADTAPPLLALKAQLKIAGSSETRIVGLEDFFVGPGETVLKYDEIVAEIQVPKLPGGTGASFIRATRGGADLATVNVATVVIIKNGVCQDARIALGGVAPTPIRADKAEKVLRTTKLENKVIEEAAQTAADQTKPITDIRSTADYRKELTKVLVRRALKMSVERAERKV